jgi:L-lactate utilization protein LutC
MTARIEGNRRVLDDVARATRSRRGDERPTLDEHAIRTAIDGPLVVRFIAEATVAGMEVTQVSRDDLVAHVKELLGPDSGTDTPILLESRLAEEHGDLRSTAGYITEPNEDDLFAATVGIVGADAAIAETGSIVRAAAPDRPRGFALVPPRVIIVLEQTRILADLYDWFDSQVPDTLRSEVVFITGPSKSSDIGMKLVTGVHGPGDVHVIIVG